MAEIIEPNAWRVAATRDGIDGFHRINYLEMSPTEPLETLYFPVGLYATIRDDGAATVDVRTAQGDFSFRLADLTDRATFLDGRAAAARVPTPELLSTEQFEDDDPAIAALPDGSLAVAWVAYAGEADRVLLRERRDGRWSAPIEATPRPGDLFRCSLAVDGEGALWVFWSERADQTWTLWGRRRERGGFGDPVRISGGGSNLFHRAAVARRPPVRRLAEPVRRADRRGLERHLAARAPRRQVARRGAGQRVAEEATGSPRSRPDRAAAPTSPGTPTIAATTT